VVAFNVPQPKEDPDREGLYQPECSSYQSAFDMKRSSLQTLNMLDIAVRLH
jgi:hypothetical protein